MKKDSRKVDEKKRKVKKKKASKRTEKSFKKRAIMDAPEIKEALAFLQEEMPEDYTTRIKEVFSGIGQGDPQMEHLLEGIGQKIPPELFAVLTALLQGVPPARLKGVSDTELECLYIIAQRYLSGGFLDKALACLKLLLQLNPFDFRFLYSFAMIYQLKSDFQAALEIYYICHFFVEEDIQIILRMAECCIALGEHRAAHAFVEEARAYCLKEKNIRDDVLDHIDLLLDFLEERKSAVDG